MSNDRQHTTALVAVDILGLLLAMVPDSESVHLLTISTQLRTASQWAPLGGPGVTVGWARNNQ